MSHVEARMALAKYIEARAVEFPEGESNIASYVERNPRTYVHHRTHKNADGTDRLSTYYRYDPYLYCVSRYDICTVDPSRKWTVSYEGGYERIKYLDGPEVMEQKYNYHTWNESVI